MKRKMMTKKLLAAVLSAAMVLSMTACTKNPAAEGEGGDAAQGASGEKEGGLLSGLFGGKEDGGSASNNNQPTGEVQYTTLENKQGVFEETPVDFSEIGSEYYIQSSAMVDGKITAVMIVYNYDDPNGYTDNDFRLVTIDPATGKVSQVPLEGTAVYSEYQEYEDGGVALYEAKLSSGIAIEEPMEPMGPEVYEGEEEGSETYTSYQSFVVTKDHIMALKNTYTYDYSTYEQTNEYSVVCWNTADGSLVSEAPVDFMDGEGYISSSFVDANGNLVLMYNENWEKFIFYTLDANGTLVSKIEPDDSSDSFNNIESLIPTKDGKVMAYYYKYNEQTYEGGYVLAEFDPSTGKLGTAMPLPTNLNGGYYNVKQGTNTDFVVTNDTGIYSFNAGDTQATKILDYLNSDINTWGFDNIIMVDDTHLFATYNDRTDYQMHVGMFSYVDPSTIADKKIITVGCFYTNYDMISRIVQFNKQSKDLRIVTKSYMDETTWDMDKAVTDFNNEAIAGKLPDVFVAGYSGMIDLTPYAKKGLFEDVEALINADSTMSMDDFLPNVFDALRVDGKAYYVVPQFEVQTVIGKTSVVGDRNTWTMQDFLDTMKKYPDAEAFNYLDRVSFMNNLMTFCGNDFVDEATGKCDFNNDTFKGALTYAATLPEEYDWNQFYDGDNYYDVDANYASDKTLLSNTTIYDARSFHTYNEGYFMADCTKIGFPTSSGMGAIIQPEGLMTISAKSPLKAEAWEFVKYYLGDEYQNQINYSIPVRKSAFDKWGEGCTEKNYWEDENGNREYYDDYCYIGGEEFVVEPMTPAQFADLKNYISSVNKAAYNNTAITAIIEEESAAFFNGQKSVDEVANIIQSRVQIYVSENM